MKRPPPPIPITPPKRLILEPVESTDSSQRFSGDSSARPQNSYVVMDPVSGTAWGYVVVDDVRRGPGLGGLRMAPNLSLNEVMRLARVMTLKNSASCIPYGGGKAGLNVDPASLSAGQKRELVSLFAEAIFPLNTYAPAPDMGTDENDMQIISEVFSRETSLSNHPIRAVAGRPEESGGIPIDAWGLTAHGLYAAAQALETVVDGFSISGSRVVIQGYGNVGSWTATKLQKAGAIIVGASDVHCALWTPRGLDVEELSKVRLTPNGLANYSGKVEKRFGPSRLDWMLEAPCDILVPAARPDAITSRNADRIDCRIILQGANTPINKMTEYYLCNRRNVHSLSDFIVNVGGVIGCAVELKMQEDAGYRSQVLEKGKRSYTEELIHSTVSKNVLEIFNRLEEKKSRDMIFRETALELAEEMLERYASEEWL